MADRFASPSRDPGAVRAPEVYTRQATGLVRQVSLLNQIVFNATSTNPLGLGLVFYVSVFILFPRSNVYVALILGGFASAFVWASYALLAAAVPRVGGEYAFNSRVLPPWLALGGNLCAFVAGVSAVPLFGYLTATLGIAPALAVIGSISDSNTFNRWSTYFTADHHLVILGTIIVSMLIISVLAALGTRVIMRVITVLIIIASIGFVIDIVILLATGHSSFIKTINDTFGAGTYHKVIEKGRAQGLYP